MRDSIDGYVLDDVYPSSFHPEFSPDWIDAMLRHRGIASPRAPGSPFALIDLGCGDGLALTVLAAAHPEGRFVGIDALPAHTEMATRTAAALGIGNVAFRCARFGDIADPPEGEFDYVTAQGVMSWVGASHREHVRRIAASHLKAGGIACIGYNAMPGWTHALAFQPMVRMLADSLEGSAVERFAAAVEQVRALGAAGAAPFSVEFLDWLDRARRTLPPSYFPHEYLNRFWTVHWSGEMIESFAAHGLTYIAPGRADRLREDFILTATQRRTLDAIDDPLARETAADLFVRSSFRVDLYARRPRLLQTTVEARLDGWWALATAPEAVSYTCRTAAGTLRFANDAARAVVDRLADGPAQLRAGHAGAGSHAEVLDAADALFVAGDIVPAGHPRQPARATELNAHIRGDATAPMRIAALVGRHGAMPFADSGEQEVRERALARMGIAAG